MLRPVMNAALAAYEKYLSSQSNKDSTNAGVFDASKINQVAIIVKVTDDLLDVWKIPVFQCLADIREGIELTSKNSMPKEVARIFLSECEYARSTNLLADYAGSKIKEIILSSDEKIIPIFVKHLCDVLSLNPQKSEALNKVLLLQILGRKRSSTSSILQGLSISSSVLDQRPANDNEFKANERKFEEDKPVPAASVTIPSSRQTDKASTQPTITEPEVTPSIPQSSRRLGYK